MIVDYFFIRKKELLLNDLYSHSGLYQYKNGFNLAAILALLLGILPNLPGFLLQIKLIEPDLFPQWVSHLYNYAWFIGFFVSGGLYWVFMKK